MRAIDVEFEQKVLVLRHGRGHGVAQPELRSWIYGDVNAAGGSCLVDELRSVGGHGEAARDVVVSRSWDVFGQGFDVELGVELDADAAVDGHRGAGGGDDVG